MRRASARANPVGKASRYARAHFRADGKSPTRRPRRIRSA
jgi:hypothetical protein